MCSTCALQAQETGSAIEKQRLSIRKQVQANGPQTGFFTTPWATDKPQGLSLPPRSIAPAAAGDCEPVAETALQKLILASCQREHVDTRVIRAMIRRESDSKPCAVSPKGAQGLMQLMPAAQIDMGLQDPFDAESNIDAGVRYLKQMLERYGGNVALALAAYNAGPQRVAPGGKIPDIPETQNYVMSILAELNEEGTTAVQ